MQAAVAAAASNVVDSFITEDEVVEGVAHGLVEVPYHLAVVVTKLSKAQRMMWDCVLGQADSADQSPEAVAWRVPRPWGRTRFWRRLENAAVPPGLPPSTCGLSPRPWRPVLARGGAPNHLGQACPPACPV